MHFINEALPGVLENRGMRLNSLRKRGDRGAKMQGKENNKEFSGLFGHDIRSFFLQMNTLYPPPLGYIMIIMTVL